VPAGNVILSPNLLRGELEVLKASPALLGVRITPDHAIEDVADLLPDLAVVEIVFPKFGDGRGYSSARLLRDRYGFRGEIRATGDVLREQALMMVRCGFDAFVPVDNSDTSDWQAAIDRYRHVYQRASDARRPAFQERSA
jgi:uncharacterized protein (DUF934 family)